MSVPRYPLRIPRRDPPLATQEERIGSHRSALLDAIARTSGPILELGAGDQSTPILDAIALATGRMLVTIDDSAQWLCRYERMVSPVHELVLVKDWSNAPIDRGPWGCALVDQSPALSRGETISRIANVSQLIVCHDAEFPQLYGYDRITLPIDRMWDYVEPWTVVYRGAMYDGR